MNRLIAFGMTMLLLLVNDETTFSKINKIKKHITRHIQLKGIKNNKNNTQESCSDLQLNEIDYAIMWAYSK